MKHILCPTFVVLLFVNCVQAAEVPFVELKGHAYQVSSVAFFPDGQRIVTGGWDNSIRIWDVASGKELKKLELEGDVSRIANGITFVAISPDGKKITTAARQASIVRIFDAESGKELGQLRGHTRVILDAAFSPNGKKIVTAGADHREETADNTARIWEVESGKELKKLAGHQWFVNSVAFLPDGKRIVTGSSDKTVRLWDAESGDVLKILEGHGDTVISVASSPDGKIIATAGGSIITAGGSIGKPVTLWDVESEKELRQLVGHTDSIMSAAFSPDGKKIVTAGRDKTVRIFDTESGKELQQLVGHTDVIHSAVFSPDGRKVATASQDTTARIWDISAMETK